MHQVNNNLIQKPSEASLPTGLSSRMVFTCLKECTKKEMQQRPYVAHVAQNTLCSFCSYRKCLLTPLQSSLSIPFYMCWVNITSPTVILLSVCLAFLNSQCTLLCEGKYEVTSHRAEHTRHRGLNKCWYNWTVSVVFSILRSKFLRSWVSPMYLPLVYVFLLSTS